METQTFLLEVGRYQNKAKGQDFATYTGYIGKRKQRITVKFRKEVKDLPTETGMITVKNSDMSISTKYQYPQLWIHAITDFTVETQNNTEKIEKLFNSDDLPF